VRCNGSKLVLLKGTRCSGSSKTDGLNTVFTVDSLSVRRSTAIIVVVTFDRCQDNFNDLSEWLEV
jgi:hypothetical protein